MRNFVMLVSILGLFAGFSVHAVEQNDEALIAQCEKQANAQGVEDINGFIAACLDEKKGYAKEQ